MKVAIVGGGVGGLSLALGLVQQGIQVRVFEQAGKLGHVGADVNLTPNSTKALDGLHAELGERLREIGSRPQRRISRQWDTGDITSDLPMGNEAEEKYGAPQLTVHRARLIDAIAGLLPEGVLKLGHKVSELKDNGDSVTTRFADENEPYTADVVVGADGIHSIVREALFGKQEAEYTGVVAYRAVVPVEKLEDVPDTDCFTKWWGPDSARQLVTFPLNKGEDLFVFATVPQSEWAEESWTTTAKIDEVMQHYEDFHPIVRQILSSCDEVMKSALRIRKPLPKWSSGRVTLLGDASHPMTPFMAQGAGQSIEDAVVLARILGAQSDGPLERDLQAYEETRKPRTARIQIKSRENDWLRAGSEADWLYEYDAWNAPLAVAVE